MPMKPINGIKSATIAELFAKADRTAAVIKTTITNSFSLCPTTLPSKTPISLPTPLSSMASATIIIPIVNKAGVLTKQAKASLKVSKFEYTSANIPIKDVTATKKTL